MERQPTERSAGNLQAENEQKSMHRTFVWKPQASKCGHHSYLDALTRKLSKDGTS